MFLSGILAFCSISPSKEASDAKKRVYFIATTVLRVIGFAGLTYLAFAYHRKNGGHIITLSPFSINTDWYGILGLIGWAYLVGANLSRTVLVDAWLCRADLSNAKEADQAQIDSAWGNDRTNLPDGVTRPCNERWFSGEAREEEADARSRWRARQIFWLAETT